ncbi:hypothetical protein OROHE_014499 [Orobanche hederae]
MHVKLRTLVPVWLLSVGRNHVSMPSGLPYKKHACVLVPSIEEQRTIDNTEAHTIDGL